MRTKIAHVTATFPPYFGGTGTVCYHNALGLARLGHEVTVFTAGGRGEKVDDPPGVVVRRLRPLFRLGNAPFLPGLLGLRGFDVVHLHHPFIFGAEMVWAVCRGRGMPYVLTHHNDLIGDGARQHLFNAYTAASAPLVFRGARKFAVVSLDHAAHCRLARRFEARWEDVVEVPNGVDVDRFRPGLDGRAVRRRHGIPGDAGLILFVGTLDRAHHFKGVGHLLEAFSMLRLPDARLMLVGDGDMRQPYESMVATQGLQKRVCFAGARSHRELPDYYCASDVVVLPSFPPESFGVVLIEAMACGRPVVAHDIPGVRSVVGDGEDGLLARPGDTQDLARKMGALLQDRERRRAMGERGRAKVEEGYAWPRIISRLSALYEELLTTEG